MEWGALLISASLSGLAVLTFTFIADRVGGTVGGLLATAPVTTAAALVYLGLDLGNQAVGTHVMEGGKSLFAAIAAMPVYFYIEKWLRPPVPLWSRILLGLGGYLAVFTGGTLLLDALTPAGLGWLWIPATLGLVALLSATFFRAHIPSRLLRGDKPPLTWMEGLARFTAGAVVIVAVTIVRELDPTLSTAWAVFPGTFVVTLGVLGFGHGAAFSARAAQGGARGAPPLIVYLLIIRLLLPLHEGLGWALLVQIPAWLGYFAVLVPVMRMRIGGDAPKAHAGGSAMQA